jgi:DNA processing protein
LLGDAGASQEGGPASQLDGRTDGSLPEVGRKLLAVLQVDSAIHLDDLLQIVEDSSASELIAALFELEMLGLVKQLPGKNFVKVW